jgi:hypothetical protein
MATPQQDFGDFYIQLLIIFIFMFLKCFLSKMFSLLYKIYFLDALLLGFAQRF